MRRRFWRFVASIGIALIWLAVSAALAALWAQDLAGRLPGFYIVFVIAGIALLPGYLLCAMFLSNLLHFRLPPLAGSYLEPVTVLICARNEEAGIYDAVRHVAQQSYEGELHILCVDNGSSDGTLAELRRAEAELCTPQRRVRILSCSEPGKARALNTGLPYVDTEYFITVDADTALDRDAVRQIISRIVEENAACVAGNLLVRRADTWVQRMQIYDYLISIAAIKRYQGSYGATLVAQGAFSAYDTALVRQVGGWELCAGEDIVLTYRLMALGRSSLYEARALAYTEVPESLRALCRQRVRWGRGMLEGLYAVAPWRQAGFFSGYFEALNLSVTFLDLAYVFGFLTGCALLLLGLPWLVGWMTLLILPAVLISSASVYVFQRQLKGIRIEKSLSGALCFLLLFRALEAFCALTGYVQAVLRWRLVWK